MCVLCLSVVRLSSLLTMAWAPLSTGILRQKLEWAAMPSSKDLLDPGIELESIKPPTHWRGRLSYH